MVTGANCWARSRRPDLPMWRACFVIILTVSHTAGAVEPWQFDAGSKNHSGLTFSPDGKTAWWAEWDGKWGGPDKGPSTIYRSEHTGKEWGEPVPAPFTDGFSDDDPFVSPDGEWLYFISDRPVDESDEDPDANIWRYSLKVPDRLEHLPVNSPQAEYSPVVTLNRRLYFASDRDGGPGRGDIYVAEPAGGSFLDPRPLDPAVNSRHGEWNVWVSPKESELIFESSSRPTNRSTPGDLYYSVRTPGGWSPAIPLGNLNSLDSDLLPRMHPDGKTLYYTTAPIGGHARIISVDWINPIAAGKHLKSNTD